MRPMPDDDAAFVATAANFDNYNLATTCPNLRMVKLIRVGARRARSTNQAEYS